MFSPTRLPLQEIYTLDPYYRAPGGTVVVEGSLRRSAQGDSEPTTTTSHHMCTHLTNHRRNGLPWRLIALSMA